MSIAGSVSNLNIDGNPVDAQANDSCPDVNMKIFVYASQSYCSLAYFVSLMVACHYLT